MKKLGRTQNVKNAMANRPRLAHVLQSKGQYLGASPLQSVATATSVQMRQRETARYRWPVRRNTEQLGGFFMIEANNLDEAIDIAGQIPGARKGTVEIRPVVEIPSLPKQ